MDDDYIKQCEKAVEIPYPHTQGQLQAILGGPAFDLVRPFYLWCSRTPEEIGNYSMEQLWLGFVMKRKFNKAWDGAGWCTVGSALDYVR